MKLVRESLNEISKSDDVLGSMGMGKAFFVKKLTKFIKDNYSYYHKITSEWPNSKLVSKLMGTPVDNMIFVGTNFQIDMISEIIAELGPYDTCVDSHGKSFYAWNDYKLVVLNKPNKDLEFYVDVSMLSPNTV